MKITINNTIIQGEGPVSVTEIPNNQYRLVGIRGEVSGLTVSSGEVSFNLPGRHFKIRKEDAPEWLENGILIEVDLVAMKLKKL
jgi:hypothetical protein